MNGLALIARGRLGLDFGVQYARIELAPESGSFCGSSMIGELHSGLHVHFCRRGPWGLRGSNPCGFAKGNGKQPPMASIRTVDADLLCISRLCAELAVMIDWRKESAK